MLQPAPGSEASLYMQVERQEQVTCQNMAISFERIGGCVLVCVCLCAAGAGHVSEHDRQLPTHGDVCVVVRGGEAGGGGLCTQPFQQQVTNNTPAQAYTLARTHARTHTRTRAYTHITRARTCARTLDLSAPEEEVSKALVVSEVMNCVCVCV